MSCFHPEHVGAVPFPGRYPASQLPQADAPPPEARQSSYALVSEEHVLSSAAVGPADGASAACIGATDGVTATCIGAGDGTWASQTCEAREDRASAIASARRTRLIILWVCWRGEACERGPACGYRADSDINALGCLSVWIRRI
jgi:hypothetical protein